MAGVAAFMKANPALYPLAAALGLGVGGGVAFGAYYLRKSPDVVVDKRVKDPWNKIKQHQNSKLLSYNGDFWKGRVGLADPRTAFLEDNQYTSHRSASTDSLLKRARAKQAMQE